MSRHNRHTGSSKSFHANGDGGQGQRETLWELLMDRDAAGAHHVQVPRRLGLLHAPLLLEAAGAFEGDRRPAEGPLRRRDGVAADGARPAGDARPPLPRAHAQRPRLPGGVAQLLRAEPLHRRAGHAGPAVQPHFAGAGGVHGAVLRPRLQHLQGDGARAVRVQVPLVLLRGVQGVHAHRRRAHVQVGRNCPAAAPATGERLDNAISWKEPSSLSWVAPVTAMTRLHCRQKQQELHS